MIFGQNFRFGFFDIPSDKRLQAIKNAGFDETMFWWGEEYKNIDGDKYDLFNEAKKCGLGVNTIHFPTTYAHCLWLDNDDAFAYKNSLISAIHDCGRLEISNLVIHLTHGKNTVPANDIGLEALQKFCKEAEHVGVKIAIENTRFLDYNRFIYSNISSKALGFCFDSGHANCFTPNEDPLSEFGKYLCTTHIHDNYGKNGIPGGLVSETGEPDLHNLIGDGNIDFVSVFTKLKSFGVKRINLESYCFKHSKFFGLSMEEYLSLSYSKLIKLAELF